MVHKHDGPRFQSKQLRVQTFVWASTLGSHQVCVLFQGGAQIAQVLALATRLTSAWATVGEASFQGRGFDLVAESGGKVVIEGYVIHGVQV